MPDYAFEHAALSGGYKIVAGTDEAGRGPLAGPVCAAAVILPIDLSLPGLDDSKKLSEKKREALYEQIVRQAISYGVAFASPEEIDEINILNASQLAMRRAVAALSPAPDLLLVDGNIAREFTMDTRTIVHGDGLSMSIAAASVLAKVTRDRYCAEMHRLYPAYGFDRHKGYPTKEHKDRVRALGPCPLHRKTFLKFLQS